MVYAVAMVVSARLAAIKSRFDDAIRSETERFQQELVDEYEEDDAPDDLLLGDWVLVTSWISADESDATWYHCLRSPGLSPHACAGLLAEYQEG